MDQRNVAAILVWAALLLLLMYVRHCYRALPVCVCECVNPQRGNERTCNRTVDINACESMMAAPSTRFARTLALGAWLPHLLSRTTFHNCTTTHNIRSLSRHTLTSTKPTAALSKSERKRALALQCVGTPLSCVNRRRLRDRS